MIANESNWSCLICAHMCVCFLSSQRLSIWLWQLLYLTTTQPALMAMWPKVLSLTASCLSPLRTCPYGRVVQGVATDCSLSLTIGCLPWWPCGLTRYHWLLTVSHHCSGAHQCKWESCQWSGIRWWFLPVLLFPPPLTTGRSRLSVIMAEKVTKKRISKFATSGNLIKLEAWFSLAIPPSWTTGLSQNFTNMAEIMKINMNICIN